MAAADVRKNCLVCNVEFTTKTWLIAKGKGKYCSRKCQFTDRKKIIPGEPVQCPRCLRLDPEEGFYTNGYCKPCGAKYYADWRKEHREQALETQRRHWHRNKVEKNAEQRHRNEVKKLTVLYHYGNECACCKESNYHFLVIDHMYGGGNYHRKSIGAFGTHMYDWLINNGFPDGFRVLCANCNAALAIAGSCPHGGVPDVPVLPRGKTKAIPDDIKLRVAGYTARPIIPRVCPQCGEPFMPTAHSDPAIFCSNQCKGLSFRKDGCSVCQRTDLPLGSNHYCRPCEAARKRKSRALKKLQK